MPKQYRILIAIGLFGKRTTLGKITQGT